MTIWRIPSKTTEPIPKSDGRDHPDFRVERLRVDTAKLPGHYSATMPISRQLSPRKSGRTEHKTASRNCRVPPHPQMLDVTGPLQVFATADRRWGETGEMPPYVLPGRGGRGMQRV